MIRALRAVLPCIALAGCLRERDRLDVPRVMLILDDSVVAAGDTVRGQAWAVDETGIIFFQVSAETRDSVAVDRRNRISADSVTIDFALPVSSRALPDEAVVIIAVARDDQEFEVSATDTVYVRASAVRQ